MIRKNKNKGFSLVELIVAVAILATLTAFLVPSYISFIGETRMEKDEIKFESICIALKTAMSDPGVIKETEKISGNGTFKVVFAVDSNGLISFGDGLFVGSETNDFDKTVLWLNSYQSIGLTYKVESSEFRNKYIVFTVTPKTSTTTVECKCEIVEDYQ